MLPFTADYISKVAQFYPNDVNGLKTALAHREVQLVAAEQFIEAGVLRGNAEREALQKQVDAKQDSVDSAWTKIRNLQEKQEILTLALVEIRDNTKDRKAKLAAAAALIKASGEASAGNL